MTYHRPDRTCARCNWRPEDDETLADHAEASGHRLCLSCGLSLPSDRPAVCRDCQDRASTHLHDIAEMWAELPDLLDAHASELLPGGDVLVLLGPGSKGPQEADDPDVARLIDDNLRAKTPSVAWTLISWADGWQRIRGEGTNDRDAVPAHDHAVTAAHAYLVKHGPWAAKHHWAWAEYAADLAHLHGSLLRATGRHRRPTRLGLDCVACRGPLEYRVIRDQDTDAPPRTARWWVGRLTTPDDTELTKVHGPVDVDEFARRHLGKAGLEEDDATCRDCGKIYDTSALLLALRKAVQDAQWLEEDGIRCWGTVKAVAEHLHRSQWSLRTWQRQGLIRHSLHGGALYLHLADAEHEDMLAEEAQWIQDEDGTRWGSVNAVADHLHRSKWTLRTWQRNGLIRGRQHLGELFLHLTDAQRETELRAPRRRAAS